MARLATMCVDLRVDVERFAFALADLAHACQRRHDLEVARTVGPVVDRKAIAAAVRPVDGPLVDLELTERKRYVRDEWTPTTTERRESVDSLRLRMRPDDSPIRQTGATPEGVQESLRFVAWHKRRRLLQSR